MDSKGIIVAGLGLGALLVAVGACSQARRSDSVPNNGSTTQGDNVAISGGVMGSSDHPLQCPASGDSASNLNTGDVAGPARITGDAPTQVGWFGPPFAPAAPDAPPVCDTPNPTPTVVDRDRDIHYNEFFFKNWTNADACISVFSITDDHLDSGFLQIGAYVGPFDPNDIAANVVAAYSHEPVAHFSFKVPASANFEVVMMAEAPVNPDGTPGSPLNVDYTLAITNCGTMPDGGAGNETDAGSSSSSSSGGNEADAGTSSGGNGQTW
jgi:hypothetical protein